MVQKNYGNKPTVRKIESPDGVIIFDDTIQDIYVRK